MDFKDFPIYAEKSDSDQAKNLKQLVTALLGDNDGSRTWQDDKYKYKVSRFKVS